MNDTPEEDTGSTGQWTADDIPSQIGRTIVVTGANSGIGFETARALAAHGAQVVMAVRDEGKGTEAVERIQAEHPDATLELRYLDLADLDTVREFAGAVRRVDVLINNAGVMMPPRELTAQGYELQFGVNHLGHFALTALLFEDLRKGRDARVVTVSSRAHMSGRMHFDDLHGEHNYSRGGYYAQSKLANVVFGLELHRRLRASGLGIRSVLAHPGVVATNLQSTGPTGLTKVVMQLGSKLVAQPAEMGALPVLYAATHPDVESGQFIGPDARNGMKGYPTVVEPLDAARDRQVARRLWEISEDLSGVRFPLPT
ncbi:oxidoreductase [Actinophytocola sp.]|uniref:oxidoreductase n=1 Tax=Actinophytocola sp. TaxID=1872138 RepID=UPI002D7FFE11|nr:oxidoreductase [Actinophytocola sp.]HET9142505.1 oxidoreductase [Actinophytocola sp.]